MSAEIARTIRPPLALSWSEALCQQGVTRFGGGVWIPAGRSAVLGISQHAQHELNLPALREDGVGILRRQSGGGAVILDQTVLCFEFFAPAGSGGIGPDLSIRESFQILTAPVCAAIEELCGRRPVMAGISDLAVEDGGQLRKICGCAQMRKRQAVLVHGSILVNTDAQQLERLLAWPSETPDYRARRSHSSFCLPLRELTGAAVDLQELAGRIRLACLAQGWDWMTLPNRQEDAPPEVCALLEAKYNSAAWNIDRKRPAPSRG